MNPTHSDGTRCAFHATELGAAPIFYSTVPPPEVTRSVRHKDDVHRN